MSFSLNGQSSKKLIRPPTGRWQDAAVEATSVQNSYCIPPLAAFTARPLL